MESRVQRTRSADRQWSVRGNNSAQALVEFALVIPLILLLFFSMIQGLLIAAGRCNWATTAAYAAARVYAVRARGAPASTTVL